MSVFNKDITWFIANIAFSTRDFMQSSILSIYIEWSYILYVAGIICLFWFTSAFTFVRTVLKHSYTLVNPIL